MKPIQAAIDHFGSVTKLARALAVTPQAVCFWRDGKRQIPADKCPLIERVTGGAVRCEEFRPDVDWAYIRNSSPRLAGDSQTEQAPALTPPAQSAITTIAKPGPTESPATTQHPPRQAPPGAAAGGDTGAAWDGVERRHVSQQQVKPNGLREIDRADGFPVVQGA